jgi:N4-gp56 family major capsid protein
MDTAANRELQNEYIERKFLEQLKPALQFYKFATEGEVPGGVGDSIRWLHFPEFSVDTSDLSETNAGDNEISAYAATAVSGSIKLSEHSAKTMPPGALDQISERLAFLGAKTVDTLLRDAAYDTVNYFKEGATAKNTGTLTAANKLRATTFTYVCAELNTSGNMGFASEGGQFASILHPVQAAHLKNEPTTASGLPTWSELNKYVQGSQGKTLAGDAGSLFGIAVKESPLITKVEVDTGVSGYRGVVLAKDGLGRAGIGDMQPEVIIKNPGKTDTSQALNTFWTYGVKFRAAHKLLSSDRVLVLYSAS